jgi:hypothetical protein
MKARQDKNESKDKKPDEEREHLQRKGSAFNEKPVGQPAHSPPGVEKSAAPPENNIEPPGLPERGGNMGDKPVL